MFDPLLKAFLFRAEVTAFYERTLADCRKWDMAQDGNSTATWWRPCVGEDFSASEDDCVQ